MREEGEGAGEQEEGGDVDEVFAQEGGTAHEEFEVVVVKRAGGVQGEPGGVDKGAARRWVRWVRWVRWLDG